MHRLIPWGLSFIFMISVSVYFVRKVYSLSKVHPAPMPTLGTTASENENKNAREENTVRRLNENPNQFFRVKIAPETNFPSQKDSFPLQNMVKKALIVNIVSLCQFLCLFPLYLIDILLLFRSCDEESSFTILLKIIGVFGVFVEG